MRTYILLNLIIGFITFPLQARQPLNELDQNIGCISAIRTDKAKLNDLVQQGVKNGFINQCAQIIATGNSDEKHPFNIDLKRKATLAERKTMVKAIMVSAVASNSAFEEIYKFAPSYENNTVYLNHMAAAYLAFTVSRGFHKMVELQSDYVANFYQQVSNETYWITHFRTVKAAHIQKIRDPLLRFVRNKLLDAILTNEFTQMYADLNKGCHDVSKQWVVREKVTYDELLFTQKAFDMNCPQAVVNIHKFGMNTYLYEEVKTSDMTNVKDVMSVVAVNAKDPKKPRFTYSEIYPQLGLFAAMNDAPVTIMRKIKEGKTYHVFGYAEPIKTSHAVPAQQAKEIIKEFHRQFGRTYRDQELYRYIDEKTPQLRRKVYKNKIRDLFKLDIDLNKIVLDDNEALLEFKGYEEGTNLWILKSIKLGKKIAENEKILTRVYHQGKFVSHNLAIEKLESEEHAYPILPSYCKLTKPSFTCTLGPKEGIEKGVYIHAKIIGLPVIIRDIKEAYKNRFQNCFGSLGTKLRSADSLKADVNVLNKGVKVSNLPPSLARLLPESYQWDYGTSISLEESFFSIIPLLFSSYEAYSPDFYNIKTK
jgi:hypothetical protein